MDIKMIGNKIARARRDKNMSQAQLAGLLFISPQAVGKWERGESLPDIATVNRLAEILGVDLNYFSENFQSAGDETALQMAVGGNEQTAQENTSRSAEPQMLTNFSGSDLSKSDFAGVA